MTQALQRSCFANPIRVLKSRSTRNEVGVVVLESNPSVRSWLKWANERHYRVLAKRTWYEIYVGD